MLPLAHRLKNEGDFARLAKSRKSAFSKALAAKVRENLLPHSRFGIVVGLKVHKRAVKRNVIKRRIREILRKHLKDVKPGYDVMVMANAKALGLEYPEIQEQMLSVLKKLGLLK